jgi:hypothetical protein
MWEDSEVSRVGWDDFGETLIFTFLRRRLLVVVRHRGCQDMPLRLPALFQILRLALSEIVQLLGEKMRQGHPV